MLGPMRRQGRRGGLIDGFAAVALSAVILIAPSNRLAAQTAGSDSNSDAEEARTDALLATPGRIPVPQTNVFATAPELEGQVASPRFTLNVLAPFSYNSNVEASPIGRSPAVEVSPLGSLSWAAPLFDLPVRLSANLRVESDRYIGPNNADLDKLGGSLRAQYVDPNNDQSYSPFFAYAPRFDFAPTFSREIATRQDLNLGFNKRFNFDANFQSVPAAGDTRGATVWSFGLTAFAQRRFRDPAPSSAALFLVPSVSYVVSEQWSASLGVEFIRRWFDSAVVYASRTDWLVEPIATVEYALPDSWFGSEANAGILGRPALDFQTAYERTSSNLSTRSFTRWVAGVALKTGWRF